MSLTDQVLAHALLLAGDLTERQQMILGALCAASANSLNARLRDGLTAEDCKADFIAADSLYALAALQEADPMARVQEVKIGEMTLKKGNSTTVAASLRQQAEVMMSPFVKDRFSFRSV